MIHAVLFGAAAVMVPPFVGTEEPVTMLVVTCSPESRPIRLAVNGRVLAASPILIEEALRALPRGRAAHVRMIGKNVPPYGCAGGLLFRLQQMGYQQVEVVAH